MPVNGSKRNSHQNLFSWVLSDGPISRCPTEYYNLWISVYRFCNCRYMGVVFYVTFPNLEKSNIPDNFLNFFAPNDVLAVIARAFLLVQMIAIFPLLMYILRIQVRQKMRTKTLFAYCCHSTISTRHTQIVNRNKNRICWNLYKAKIDGVRDKSRVKCVV